MNFEWDEAKRHAILLARGIDILDAALIFEGEILTRIDDRKDYGEERMISIGYADRECYVVVYTKRNETIRLITAWKGGRHDRKYYSESVAGGDTSDEAKG